VTVQELIEELRCRSLGVMPVLSCTENILLPVRRIFKKRAVMFYSSKPVPRNIEYHLVGEDQFCFLHMPRCDVVVMTYDVALGSPMTIQGLIADLEDDEMLQGAVLVTHPFAPPIERGPDVAYPLHSVGIASVCKEGTNYRRVEEDKASGVAIVFS